MRFIVTSEGENLTAVANRLFCPKDKQEITDARRRLLELNPHLPERKNIPPGTVVLVPKDLDGVEPREGKTFADVAEGALGQLYQLVSQLEETLDQQSREESESQSAEQKALGDAQLRRAARENPELAQRLEQIGVAVTDRQQRTKELTQFRIQASSEIRDDLADLAKITGGTIPG